MMVDLNPDALAGCGDIELDSRAGVQAVTDRMIYDYVIKIRGLPEESARTFSEYLDFEWNAYNEEGKLTNGAVINDALSYWRGQ